MSYNSTIISKKRLLACGCFDYAFSKNMCKAHATIKSTQKRISKHEEQEEDLSLKYLVEDLDAIFSKYIRLRYADEKGIVQCVTCDAKGKWTDFDCGHFIHRQDYITRWNEYNTAPQCKTCNQFEYGKSKKFAAYIDSLNEGMSDWLAEQARTIWKPSREELKSMIIEYRHKLKLIKHNDNK